MKALGFGVGATAAAGVALPAFQDIDDMITSTPQKQHPWWVKERDHNNITTQIDWDIFKSFDMATGWSGSSYSANPIVPPNFDVRDTLRAQQTARRAAERPGFTYRDRALFEAYAASTSSVFAAALSPVGTAPVYTDRKWQGTPEENFQTVQAALHWMGTDHVGALELNDKTKRLYNNTYTFNAADGEATATNLPKNATSVISYASRQDYPMGKLSLIQSEQKASDGKFKSGHVTDLGFSAMYRAYANSYILEYHVNRFISALGWFVHRHHFWDSPNVPYGIFAGLGEQGRPAYLMSPTYGLLTRYTCSTLTDMPIAPQKPIDFGGTKFCETCRRCAESCPSGAMGDENYKETSFEPAHNGLRSGFKGWRIDYKKCKGAGAPIDCGSCQFLCPFNHPNEALMHPVVRMTAATTSLFNGFFGSMDRYVYKDANSDKTLEEWWNRDLKSYRGDTITSAGTYKWNF